ncbi:hypothetical protein C8R32_110103 [Nitrosospira sp. Nsp5]|uniref:Uncharacterized protein n=1 Tax=Nitrosospira multiformis TaxID=1231 RepID=A0ABY0T6W5_9PROT|nr:MULTISPECIES: hypothetical protein [Nitrosospira]PTR06619.1 hypothetical protein C8R32_110103 [Nitrosospira sp. Nsp5]SDQ36168.1 hypothetical protein SAMN05216402_0555 [Nitrosospira multiformis]
MVKKIFLYFGLWAFPFAVSAQVDCSLLDPRVSVSSEKEGKISVALNTLYKIAKIDSGIEGKLKDEIKNLQQGSDTVSESLAVKARTLYLFCGMVANAKDLSTERKFELFTILQGTTQDSRNEQIVPKPSVTSRPSTNLSSSSSTKGSPIVSEWIFGTSTLERSCYYSWDIFPQGGAKLQLEASTAVVKGWSFGVVFQNSSLFAGKFFDIRDLQVVLSLDGVPTKLNWRHGISDENGIISSKFDYIVKYDFKNNVSDPSPQYEARRQKLTSARELSIKLSGFGKSYPPVKVSAQSLKERIKRRECPYTDVSEILNTFVR